MKLRFLAAFLAIAAFVPAVAAGAQSPEDRASALTAVADGTNGSIAGAQPVVSFSPGGGTRASMPPQTAPQVYRREPTLEAMDGGLVLKHLRLLELADGNLAAGTARASSQSDVVEITVMGTKITAEEIRAESRATCDGPGTAAQAAAGSHLVGLTIGGERVAVEDINTVSRVTETPAGRVEVSALSVRPAASGIGWTTVALTIRTESAPLPYPFEPTTVKATYELGIASTSLTCA
jgi:hypothetical protein